MGEVGENHNTRGGDGPRGWERRASGRSRSAREGWRREVAALTPLPFTPRITIIIIPTLGRAPLTALCQSHRYDRHVVRALLYVVRFVFLFSFLPFFFDVSLRSRTRSFPLFSIRDTGIERTLPRVISNYTIRRDPYLHSAFNVEYDDIIFLVDGITLDTTLSKIVINAFFVYVVIMVFFSYVSCKYVSCGRREKERKREKENIVYILLELDRYQEKFLLSREPYDYLQ